MGQFAHELIDSFNSHDPQRIAASYHPHATMTAPPDVALAGRDACAGYALAWLNAFPDAHIDVHNELISGDTVAHEFTFRGTHTETLNGPAGDIPATGRRVEARGAQVVRAKDWMVHDLQLYFDQVQVMTQLGVMPEPVAA